MVEKLETRTTITFCDEFGMKIRKITFDDLVLDYSVGTKIKINAFHKNLSGVYRVSAKSSIPNLEISNYSFRKIRYLSGEDVI